MKGTGSGFHLAVQRQEFAGAQPANSFGLFAPAADAQVETEEDANGRDSSAIEA